MEADRRVVDRDTSTIVPVAFELVSVGVDRARCERNPAVRSRVVEWERCTRLDERRR